MPAKATPSATGLVELQRLAAIEERQDNLESLLRIVESQIERKSRELDGSLQKSERSRRKWSDIFWAIAFSIIATPIAGIIFWIVSRAFAKDEEIREDNFAKTARGKLAQMDRDKSIQEELKELEKEAGSVKCGNRINKN